MPTAIATAAPAPEDRPFGLQQAAEYLGVSDRTLTTLIQRQKVKSIRIAGRRLIPAAEVHRLATQGTEN